MAYTVLARKYRSQTFDEVIGQDPIAKTLKNAIKTGKVAHAYLFTGTRGVGKTTMARILAKSLNCHRSKAPTTKPCCKCESCVAINIGEDIDVIEIDGATNNGVEQVRQLRENAIYRPARSRYKIYIIDEVHMLSVAAFNALLKTLEEPPSHIKFIFATTEPNKVIATIQSRCQRFDFSNISAAKIAEQLKSVLKQENMEYQEDLILPLAKMANGSMRDGLSLLDRLISTGAQPLTVDLLEEYLGQPNAEKIHGLVSQIGDSNAGGTLTAADDLINTGLSEVQIADALIHFMRDMMVIKAAGAQSDFLALTDEQRRRAGELAEKFDTAALVYSITTLERLRWAMKNSDAPRALLEASLLRFALSEHFLNIDELVSQARSSPRPAVKKKERIDREVSTEVPPDEGKPRQAIDYPVPDTQSTANDAPERTDSQSIQDRWQDILGALAAKLGNGTASLLNSATPTRFRDGVLTLEFDASARMQKQMCESNHRTEQIRSVLAEQLGVPVSLKFELAGGDKVQAEPSTRRAKTSSQRKNEIVSDPAVKTVLMGLDASITRIEED